MVGSFDIVELIDVKCKKKLEKRFSRGLRSHTHTIGEEFVFVLLPWSISKATHGKQFEYNEIYAALCVCNQLNITHVEQCICVNCVRMNAENSNGEKMVIVLFRCVVYFVDTTVKRLD